MPKNDEKNSEKGDKNKKWEFADYAFLITGIVVAFLLVVPDILYAQFGIIILGGSLGDVPEYGFDPDAWTIHDFRALSPLLFLVTTTVTFFKDAIDARRTGGYTGSVFTHTFESLLEDSIYMAVTTIMVFGAVFANAMYISWLAGPITWFVFMLIFPLVKKKRGTASDVHIPWFLLFVFALGIIGEAITMAWIAFPLSWLIICVFKLVNTIRENDGTIDTVFDILYYAFSVALMAAGVAFDFWLTSWMAFPVGLVICWILSKFPKYKKAKN